MAKNFIKEVKLFCTVSLLKIQIKIILESKNASINYKLSLNQFGVFEKLNKCLESMCLTVKLRMKERE